MSGQENISYIKKMVDESVSQKLMEFQVKINDLNKQLVKSKARFDDYLKNIQNIEVTDSRLQQSVQLVLCQMQNTILRKLVQEITNEFGNTRESKVLESTPNTGADSLCQNFADLTIDKDGNEIDTSINAIWSDPEDGIDLAVDTIGPFTNKGCSPASECRIIPSSKLEKNIFNKSPSERLKSPGGYEHHQVVKQASDLVYPNAVKNRSPIPIDVVAKSRRSDADTVKNDNKERKETCLQVQGVSEVSKEMLSLETQAASETNAMPKTVANFESLSYESLLSAKARQQQTSQRIHQEMANKQESECKSIEAAINSSNEHNRGDAYEIEGNPISLEGQLENDQEDRNNSKEIEKHDVKSSAEGKHQTSTDIAARGDPPEDKTKADESSQHKQSSKSKFNLHKKLGSKGKSKIDKS